MAAKLVMVTTLNVQGRREVKEQTVSKTNLQGIGAHNKMLQPVFGDLPIVTKSETTPSTSSSLI